MMKNRGAFTLVELLVCIAIIGLMMALLLPAIQSIRESARQVQCRNNIKQLSLACHQYESTYKIFPAYAGEKPPAFVVYADRQQNLAKRGWNWIPKAMMFMEQTQLAKHWGVFGATEIYTLDDDDQRVVQTPLPNLHCPTRRPAEAYPLIDSYQPRFGMSAARTDYAMNGGPGIPEDKETGDENTIHVSLDGVWRLGLSTRASSISDGLSNTYFIGEKAMSSDKYDTGTDFGDRAPISGWIDHPTSSNSSIRFAARSPVTDGPNNCLACHDFGSAHRTNWNVSLADGSVRPINYELDLEVHRAMASIKGREKMTLE